MIHHNHYQTSSAGNITSNSNSLNQITQFTSINLFPPTISASDIAKKRLRSKICSKSPNAFFIYRKAFVDQLSNFTGNNKLKMTEVSRLVSSRWKKESKQVKLAYEEIAKQVEQELNNIRNKDLVYTDDFDIGRRRKKNHKKGRRSEFGCDFFMNLKGNFNILTLDFSVKPNNNNNNNNNNNLDQVPNNDCGSNSNSPSLSFSPLQSESSSEGKDSVNYEENKSENDYNDNNDSNDNNDNNNINNINDNNNINDINDNNNINDINDSNDNNDNNQLQQTNYDIGEYYNSPISDELIYDDSNVLTPPNCGSELDTLYHNDHNDINGYIIQCQPNEFNFYESLLKTNEISTPTPYPVFDDHGLDYYLGCFDNLP